MSFAPDIELRCSGRLRLIQPVADGLLGCVVERRAALGQLGPVDQADALAIVDTVGDQGVRGVGGCG